MTERMTGAQALVRALERVGVDTVFGIPGGTILPAYDPLFDSQQVRHILVRHEQGAGHAAQGYAQATGAVPDSHPRHMGTPGMHGNGGAAGALQRADLVVALGARFDDRVTGRIDTFAADAKVVHAAIDPAEISKNRHADVPIVGDCRDVLTDLLVAVRNEHTAGRKGG